MLTAKCEQLTLMYKINNINCKKSVARSWHTNQNLKGLGHNDILEYILPPNNNSEKNLETKTKSQKLYKKIRKPLVIVW